MPVTPLDFNSQAAAEERQLTGMTQGQQRYTSGYREGDQIRLANIIFGEAAGASTPTMHMVGSAVLNRLESGRAGEFGSTIEEVINSEKSPFYAVKGKDGNKNYEMALSQKFDNEISEQAYKRALQIAGGLLSGSIDRHKVQFFFTDDEVKNIKKSRKKDKFDFKKVVETGRVGKYNTFSY